MFTSRGIVGVEDPIFFENKKCKTAHSAITPMMSEKPSIATPNIYLYAYN